MGKHSLPDSDGFVREPGMRPRTFTKAIPVRVLLERAIVLRDAIRLNWGNNEMDEATGLVRQCGAGEFPTGVIPRLRDV